MAIGKSLSYQENCDNFLKNILARKNLSSCWIYADKNGECVVPYSLPLPDRDVDKVINKAFLKELYSKSRAFSYPIDNNLRSISPNSVKTGCIAVFNMGNQGLLFLHSSVKEAFSQVELVQLEPIINKFALSLEACNTHETQQELLEDMEKQNQELNNYAQMVSHDLKSPLRNINALAYWLKEDFAKELPADALNKLQLIGDNLEKIDRLIHGILTYTKIDRHEETEEQVNLDKLLVEIKQNLIIPPGTSIETSDNLPVIKANKFMLTELFGHLITNAVNAMDKLEGCIKLSYKDTGSYHKFVLSDNGRGIDEKYLKRVFGIFQKLDSTSTSSGIGLAIVKKIVNSYEGDIYIESKLTMGTKVIFSLKKEI